MTSRREPSVGTGVTILYLGTQVRGTIARVSEDLREFDVMTDDNAEIRFRLNPATARFTADGESTGARIAFDLPADD
jgi:hypothetical protein